MMSSYQIVISKDHADAIAFAAQHWIDSAKAAIRDHAAFYVALSGGSTPKEIYQALCHPPYRASIPWEKVHLFWSDERPVPPIDPQSNYRMAMEAGLKHLPIPKEQIHRMVAEEKIEENAQAYERLIKKELGDRPFDLILLGLGEDGHTASLFPNTAALEEKRRLVVANAVPRLNTLRMTFTYPLLNAAKECMIVALEEKKARPLKAALQPAPRDPAYPVQRVGTKERPALWIVDPAAAKLLIQS